jgi:hypothetical protein
MVSIVFKRLLATASNPSIDQVTQPQQVAGTWGAQPAGQRDGQLAVILTETAAENAVLCGFSGIRDFVNFLLFFKIENFWLFVYKKFNQFVLTGFLRNLMVGIIWRGWV